MKGSIVVKISGREALPVWTLPLVTAGELSPDMLLDRLANPEYDLTATFPAAFRRDGSDSLALIPREQWKGVYIKVKSISEQLKNENLPPYHDKDEWRKRSIAEIHQYKSYVWLNEFQDWFNKQLYAHKTIGIDDHGFEIEGPGIPFCLQPNLGEEYLTYFQDETQLLETKKTCDTSAPLDAKDKEKQEEIIFKKGSPTISLGKFVDTVLAEAIGDNITLPTLYQLIENHGLVVYDKVVYGKKVSSDKLLAALKQREQQADDSFDDDSFQFWNTLSKELRYSVFRDDVAKAYLHAGKLQFPWQNLANEFIWLHCLSHSSNGMVDKLKLKQNLPQEPTKLNTRYQPENSFKQEKWDAIPNVKQKYWKCRDTLTIIEFAFILKGKEPQPTVTQYSVKNLPDYVLASATSRS